MRQVAEIPGGTRDKDGDRSKEVRILFINTTEFFGPAMQVHSQIMKHLDPKIYRIFVATNSHGNSGEQFRRMPNVVTTEYDLGGSLIGKHGFWAKAVRVFFNIPTLLSFLRILWFVRRERIDLIHAGSNPRMAFLGIPLCLFSGAKLVVHVHAEPRNRGFLRGSLIELGLRRADAVITVSRYMKDIVCGLGISPYKVWPVLNVVDVEKFHPRNEGTKIRREFQIEQHVPLIATVGRITPQKGQKDLLQALVAVRQADPDVKALLVGWDAGTKVSGGRTYLQELQEFCGQHSLTDTVIFGGARTDVPEIFAAADLVVVPSSHAESCPLVVLEAMSTGKPVVGTECGGIPELLENEGGILVPPGHPQDLLKAIIRLLKQPVLRNRLGRNARTRVEERFYESRLAEEVEKVYEAVLE